MAIRASFRLFLAGLVGILTPIAISPTTAESQSPSSEFSESSTTSQHEEFAEPAVSTETNAVIETKKDELGL